MFFVFASVFMPSAAISRQRQSVLGLSVSVIMYWKFMNTTSYSLWEILQTTCGNFTKFVTGAIGDKGELICVWGQRSGHNGTKYGQKKHFVNFEGHALQTAYPGKAYRLTLRSRGSSMISLMK